MDGKKAFSGQRICPEINLNWVEKLKLLGILFNPQCQNMVDENVRIKKGAMLRTIGLLGGGRAGICPCLEELPTVAKSLLLSQLTHVISSLPDPSEKIDKRNKQNTVHICIELKKESTQKDEVMATCRGERGNTGR